MRCCICGFDMVWRINGETHYEGSEYQGNSTYAYVTNRPADHSRCCDWCDRLHETPARMGMTGQEAEMLGRAMVIANAISIHMFEKLMIDENEPRLPANEIFIGDPRDSIIGDDIS
jgi:hypothetical protein